MHLLGLLQELGYLDGAVWQLRSDTTQEVRTYRLEGSCVVYGIISAPAQRMTIPKFLQWYQPKIHRKSDITVGVTKSVATRLRSLGSTTTEDTPLTTELS